MLRERKAISIIMAIVLCMAFIAPVFVAPGVAQAAMTATVAQSNYVTATSGVALGYAKVEVDVADWSAPSVSGSALMVSFPTKLGTAGSTVTLADTHPAAAVSRYYVVTPQTAGTTNTLSAAGLTVTAEAAGAFTITIHKVNAANTKGWFYIHFDQINATNFAGDVNVTLIPEAGTAFGSTPTPLVVGKVAVSGTTTTAAKSVAKINSAGGQIDTISIFENMTNTIASPAAISLELVTKGYSWNNILGQRVPDGNATGPMASSKFAFVAESNLPCVAAGFTGGGTAIDTFNMRRTVALPTAPGAITITGMYVTVDEKVAKVGQDIEVKVSGGGVTEQTIIVGQYVDFVSTVIEDTTTEMTAGLDTQKIGTFFVEEVAPGTLIPNRTILFELPAGVEWNTAAIAASNYELVNNSAMTFTGGSRLDARTLKFTVNTGSANATNGAKVKFKGLKVDVSPSFAGDVTLTVKGKAGIEGTAKVATVNPMIKMTAGAPEVNLGIKEQKAADVEVVEQKASTIVAKIGGTAQNMAFYLDSGFRFAKIPKVEIVSGDMVLEVSDVKIQAPANGQNLLIVPIRAASYKTPAKIKISDIYITADRNAPVGDVVLYAADTNTYANTALCNAFNSTARDGFKYDVPSSVVIAKNVTTPPIENKGTTGGGSGTFVIGSNIYTVNGMTKVMDAAPYIKSGRTYVPYRYLALALGVPTEDIVWDAATQKVTVTKGTTVVEATIGSTTLTVNGEAKVMDVAPEISGSRTMLPARYLAEALGATVGWDPATKTVVFEM